MSRPPEIVNIKRKRDDDPVDVLRIHELNNKKQRKGGSEWVFCLKPTTDSSSLNQPTPPALRKIKDTHHSATPQAVTSTSAPVSRTDTPDILDSQQAQSRIDTQASTTPGTPTTSTSQLSKPTLPRHFHISRSASSLSTSTISGGIRKRKADPTIFIERRSLPRSRDGNPSNGSDRGTPTNQTFSESSKPQKRPGLAARSATPPIIKAPASTPVPERTIAPLRNVRMPSGDIIPWDISSERLAAEMQAYTLAEIGKNIAASPIPKRETSHTSSYLRGNTPSKFKPKAPAQRYAERHPEDKYLENRDMVMDLDGPYEEDEIDDDAEYIIDTYIRMPADAFEAENQPKNIGFLVLDSQPDIDEFYREEEDSDEEEDDLDEDENAENHYTADYPDEEVDSDDEYDRNAYNYRNHNASDNEEYGADGDEMTFSDEEDERSKYPWLKAVRPKNGFGGEEDDE